MAGAAVGGTVSIILKKQNYEYPNNADIPI